MRRRKTQGARGDNKANADKDALPGDSTSLAHQLLKLYKSNESLGRQQEWTLDDIKGAAGAVFIAGADTVSQKGILP